jgi:hypothetical protein
MLTAEAIAVGFFLALFAREVAKGRAARVCSCRIQGCRDLVHPVLPNLAAKCGVIFF